MTLFSAAFSPYPRTAAAILLLFGGAAAFLWGALHPAQPEAAAFAAVALCLLLAGACGPFVYSRQEGDPAFGPLARGALRCLLGAAFAAALCAAYASAHGGPVGLAAWAGAFAGLYALSSGALGDLLGGLSGGRGGRVIAGLLAVVLLGSLFYWDDCFLLHTRDRKGSAETAYEINAAAAASTTLDFDWLHAPELYRDNQTAESMAGVRRPGLDVFAGRVALAGALAAAGGIVLSFLRRRFAS